MKILRVIVVSALVSLAVAAAHSGIFDRGTVKQMVPVRADTAPMPTCLPGDPGCPQ